MKVYKGISGRGKCKYKAPGAGKIMDNKVTRHLTWSKREEREEGAGTVDSLYRALRPLTPGGRSQSEIGDIGGMISFSF